jgi:hypothetical protein
MVLENGHYFHIRPAACKHEKASRKASSMIQFHVSWRLLSGISRWR